MTNPGTLPLPENKHIAFIKLSQTGQFHDDCWAEPGERVLLVGFRRSEHKGTTKALTATAEKNSYVEEDCLGTKVAGKYKAIIADDPEKIRAFFECLQQEGVFTEAEKNKAVQHFGVRGQRIHPFIRTEVLSGYGAGI